MTNEELRAAMRAELNLDILTLEDCNYRFKKMGQTAVVNDGKLLGFINEAELPHRPQGNYIEKYVPIKGGNGLLLVYYEELGGELNAKAS